MASHERRQHDETTTIDKMNQNLTEAGSKIANNKKIIFVVIGVILVVAAFTMSYLFIFRNPHIEKSFEELNGIETETALSDSLLTQRYKEVADKYSGDTAGKLAALNAGEALYDQGNYEEAIKYLKMFSSKDNILESNVYALIGDCYVNLDKYDEALDYYGKSVRKADNNPQIVPRVLLKEANIYDAQQNYEKALSCYVMIRDHYPEFKLGNNIEIEAYIAREEARISQ